MDQAHYDELLSAYFDRELSPDERAAVDRLLEKSDEARQRLRELEITSRFLRNLPQRQPATDLADDVIERLRGESLLRPEPVAPRPARRRNVWAVGAPLAAAATLLLWLGIWNYRGGHTEIAAPPGPFAHELAESTAAPFNTDQWHKGDILEIRGPTGEAKFELTVLATTLEPNTIRCILAEYRDREPNKADEAAPESDTDVAQSGATLAIEADLDHLDRFRELLAQANDGTGVAFPLVDIVTDVEPEGIRVAMIDPQKRSAGLGSDQDLSAARASDKRDVEAGAANFSKNQAASASDKQSITNAGARRTRMVPEPAAPSQAQEDQVASLQRVLPLNSGLPLAMPDAADGDAAPFRSETALAEKVSSATGMAARQSTAALQDRGHPVPVRKIRQMDVTQQVADTPDSPTASALPRSTPGQVKELADRKPAERPGLSFRKSRQDNKELPPRVEVLLRFRNDRPE
jgi:hypothetical protein